MGENHITCYGGCSNRAFQLKSPLLLIEFVYSYWPSKWQQLKGLLTPQNENLVFNQLTPPCVSTVKALFFFGNEFKIFWMKTGGLWLFHNCQVNNTVKAQKSIERYNQNSPSAISGSIWLLWSYEILFVRKEKKLYYELWIKFFFFFCVQKVFSSLHNSQIEPLMADVIYTFLGLDRVNCLAVNGTVTNLPVFI